MRLADSPWSLPTTVATRALTLPSGHVVQAWCPAPAETHRLGWYEPAAALGRAIRAQVGAFLPLDDLRFLGRIDRPRRPALWVYERPASGALVLVDVDGVPHHVVDDARCKVGYRFEVIGPSAAAGVLGLHPAAHHVGEAPGGRRAHGGGVVVPFRRR